MDNSATTFQLPTGRKYNKNRRNDTRGPRNTQRRFQGRTSNRRLISILLKRYEQMIQRRFGDNLENVDKKQLLLDCFHYDLNITMDMNIPYTHLDELAKNETPRNTEQIEEVEDEPDVVDDEEED